MTETALIVASGSTQLAVLAVSLTAIVMRLRGRRATDRSPQRPSTTDLLTTLGVMTAMWVATLAWPQLPAQLNELLFYWMAPLVRSARPAWLLALLLGISFVPLLCALAAALLWWRFPSAQRQVGPEGT